MSLPGKDYWATFFKANWLAELGIYQFRVINK